MNSLSPKLVQDIESEMTMAVKDLLGSGYTSDYYRNMASEFIRAAESLCATAAKSPVTPIRPPPPEPELIRAGNAMWALLKPHTKDPVAETILKDWEDITKKLGS